jgi:hypothetical protein
MADASGIDPIETITKIHHDMVFLQCAPGPYHNGGSPTFLHQKVRPPQKAPG